MNCLKLFIHQAIVNKIYSFQEGFFSKQSAILKCCPFTLKLIWFNFIVFFLFIQFFTNAINFFFSICVNHFFRNWKANTHHTTNNKQLFLKPCDCQRSRVYNKEINTSNKQATCMITRNYHSKMKIAVIVLSCFSAVIIIAFACLSLKKYAHT